MCRFFATLLEPASSGGASHTWPRSLQQAFYMNPIAKWTSDVIFVVWASACRQAVHHVLMEGKGVG